MDDLLPYTFYDYSRVGAVRCVYVLFSVVTFCQKAFLKLPTVFNGSTLQKYGNEFPLTSSIPRLSCVCRLILLLKKYGRILDICLAG